VHTLVLMSVFLEMFVLKTMELLLAKQLDHKSQVELALLMHAAQAIIAVLHPTKLAKLSTQVQSLALTLPTAHLVQPASAHTLLEQLTA